VESQDLDAAREQRVVILASVLLGVDDHEVGAKFNDPRNIGILRASYVFEVRSLTESSTGNRRAIPGRERLGHRRNKADNPHVYIMDAVTKVTT
jgi:hypothetical protein